MIISASRRTDIPAFYTKWFMNRIKAGFVLTRNPFNAHQVKRVSLLPNDVDAIVFWTRNAEKLISFFPELDSKNYKYYIQYTITGYPRLLEKSVPKLTRAIEIFTKASDLLGSGKVIWRYDPILLSNYVSINDHKRAFAEIAERLEGRTRRVVISFADFYQKTERNLKTIDGLVYSDILTDARQLSDLVQYMVETATQYGMEIQSCAEAIDLKGMGVAHGKCIDDDLLQMEFGLTLNLKKDKGQREECGCVKSIDIGQYNTCLHGCSYCYATFSGNVVAKNKRLHDPNSPFLVGGTEGVDEELLRPVINNPRQLKLFDN